MRLVVDRTDYWRGLCGLRVFMGRLAAVEGGWPLL